MYHQRCKQDKAGALGLKVLRDVTSTLTGEEYSIIPKVRVDRMIRHVDAYSAGKRGKEWVPLSLCHIKQRLAPAEQISYQRATYNVLAYPADGGGSRRNKAR